MTVALWCPFATKREMPYNNTLPKRDLSKTLILHTNGGGTDNGSLYGWFSRPGNDICSHFQVMKSGTIEQYVSLDRQAYAQFSGNAFGVSVETEDDGKPSVPWTTAQVASIVRLCQWLNVPAKISPDGQGGGVGWHSLYKDWNQSQHDCPGSVRVAQIKSQVLPALTVPGTPLAPATKAALKAGNTNDATATTNLSKRTQAVAAENGERALLKDRKVAATALIKQIDRVLAIRP